LKCSANPWRWGLVQTRGDGDCSLITPERVLSGYNKDLIFINNASWIFVSYSDLHFLKFKLF